MHQCKKVFLLFSLFLLNLISNALFSAAPPTCNLDATNVVDNNDFRKKIAAFKGFLDTLPTDQKNEFLAYFKNNPSYDSNRPAYNTNNPVREYNTWRSMKLNQAAEANLVAQAQIDAANRIAAQEKARREEVAQRLKAEQERAEQKRLELERQKQEAEQKALKEENARKKADQEKAELAKQNQEVIASKDQQIATMNNNLTLTSGLAGIGNQAQIGQLISIIGASDVQADPLVADDRDLSLTLNYRKNGAAQPSLRLIFADQQKYQQARDTITFLFTLFSKTYERASSAMGDLVTDILSSAQPQDYHLTQIDHLSKTSSTLKDHLNYHVDKDKNLRAWNALPLKNFLRINFLPQQQVEILKNTVLLKFQAVYAQIPLQDNLPLGSQALGDFLEKIRLSIVMPTQINFSTQEIEKIFEELGLLLEIPQPGEKIFDNDYYSALYEYSVSLGELQKTVQAKLSPDEYNDQGYKALFDELQKEIADSNIVTAFDQSRFRLDMNIQLKAKSCAQLHQMVYILKGGSKDVDMPCDANFAVELIKAGDLAPIRFVLSFMGSFALDGFNAVLAKSVLGQLDPAIQAVCKSYFGRSIDQIKQQLLNGNGLGFSMDEYKSLKASQNIILIKSYLDSAMVGTIAAVDLNQLKQDMLGINLDQPEKIKTALVIRACELLNSQKIAQKLDTQNVAEIAEKSAYFEKPEVLQAKLEYDLQHNPLVTDDDKERFADSYIKKAGDVNLLNNFFDASFAATAKNIELVKLVSTLPIINLEYKDAYNSFLTSANAFGGQANLDDILKATQTAGYNQDQLLIVQRILGKLITLKKVAAEFLQKGDQTAALVNTSTAAPLQTGFTFSAGISQLNLERVFSTNEYFGTFYNAYKVLHYLELSMPSNEELDLLKQELVLKQPLLQQRLDAVLGAYQNLHSEAGKFSKNIRELLKFVEDFKEQKDKYHTPLASESIDFYADIDKLLALNTGGAAAGTSVPMSAPSNNRPNLFGGGGNASGVAGAKLSLAGLRGKNAVVLNKYIYSELDDKTLDAWFAETDLKNFLGYQINYLKNIDFSNLKEEDVLNFVKQIAACADLYLRIKLQDKLNGVYDAAARGHAKNNALDDLNKFKSRYFSAKYDTKTISKPYAKAPILMSDNDDTIVMLALRSVTPDLKKEIGQTMIDLLTREIDRVRFGSNSSASSSPASTLVDVITPLITLIDTYISTKQVKDIIAKK